MRYNVLKVKSLLSFFFIIVSFSSATFAQLISVVPQQPYFGKIPIGSKAIRQISVYNLDTRELNISSITLPNVPQFKLLNNPGAKTLGVAEYFVFNVEFTPTNTGQVTAELIIVSNASSSPNKYTITGYGTWGTKPTFERVFGEIDYDEVNSIQQTPDGGYLLGGSIQLSDKEYSDYYIVKTNDLGEIIWTHNYGEENVSEGIKQIEQKADGSFILFGSRQTMKNSTNDLYFAKLNSDRTVAWQKQFGGNEEESAGSFLGMPDGGFFLVGTSRSFATSTQIYLIKTDKDGNKVWEKTYGGSGGDAGKKIIPTRDGNYLIIATTSSKGAGNFDVYLLKINSNGDIIWEKTHGGSDWDEATDIAELSDGSFIISGYSLSYSIFGGQDWLVLKVDSSGDFVWRRVFGAQYQDYASRVAIADDGFVILGTTMVQILPQPKNDLLVIKTDFNGNELWRLQLGGDENESGNDIIINSDGHAVIAGSTSSYSSNIDSYFLNINTSGKITKVEQTSEVIPTDIVLYQNYPNPFNNQTKISYQINQPANIEVSIQNVLGQKIQTLEKEYKNAGVHSISFNSDGLSSGIYFCVLKVGNQILVNKILLLK